MLNKHGTFNHLLQSLVIGSSGFIGSAIQRHLRCPGTYRANAINGKIRLDITNRAEVEAVFARINPQVVYHCAGMTNMDACETDQDAAFRINVYGTENIVRACRKYHSKLVFFSTSHVFSEGRPTEYSKCHPANYYAQTKYEGERIVAESGINYLIIRTDRPYGIIQPHHRPTSIHLMLRSLLAGRQFNEITDWFNTPTYVGDLVNKTVQLLQKSQSGLIHVAGCDYLNRFDWSTAVAKVFGLDPALIIPVHSSSFNFAAARVNVHLDTSKLTNIISAPIGVREGAMLFHGMTIHG